jgi:phenylpropionate dioxygenase-like ring-hydroxylating dioxygenase large terminal subunit
MSESRAFPNGWFAVAFSGDILPGTAIPGRIFGSDIVVWRTGSGGIAVNDAYCPHLGAHLGYGGKVDDDGISCPFHGWRFDRGGRCVDVPYEKTKPNAELRAWLVREQNGVVLVWHHNEGIPPTWEMPVLSEMSANADITRAWTVRGCPEDICENGVDFAHFRWVHGTEMVEASSPVEIEGPSLSVKVRPREEFADPSLPRVGLLSRVLGPGLVFAEIDQDGLKHRARLYSTPIDNEYVALRGMVAVNAGAHPDPAAVYEMMSGAVIGQWEQDIVVWENKIRRERPMLTASEGAIAKYRNWYRQFYQ